ncbi:MAG: hypothetical protein AAGJ08_00045 [Cyanobacteria bacterium P01_H01_bin.35]
MIWYLKYLETDLYFDAKSELKAEFISLYGEDDGLDEFYFYLSL